MNVNISLFKNLLNINYSSLRPCHKLPKGIEYYGFTYYPRHENFKDPPYEPSKLFFVKRIKSLKGTTAAEKEALERLNIDGNKRYKGDETVVKNTVYTNALLWKVKHLVVIKPITIKGELPKEDDLSGTYLRETGEFIISPKLHVSPEQIETSENFVKYKHSQLNRKYLKEYLKNKWLDSYSAYV